MSLLSVFRKSLKEQSRDLLALALSLVFAPFFVILYYMFFPSGSTTYGVLVLNRDVAVRQADGSTLNGGSDVLAALKSVTYANGNPLLKVSLITDRTEAETRLRNRDATVLLVIPEDFSRTIQAVAAGQTVTPTAVTFAGDLSNPYYAVAAVLATSALDEYVQAATGKPSPIQLVEEPLGLSAARSEFETYVPGLLVFAVVMLVFLSAMAVTREIEAGTLRRLQITRMTALDFLGGISAAVALDGAVAVVLAFLTALALGFHSLGPLWVAVAVGIITSFSIIGVGLIVACFSRTVNQAFLIANFPLVLFMFFSGAIYPVPKVVLFSVGGHIIGLYDILPPTHAVVALNKVLSLGAGLGDVLYELSALVILSVIYFAAGVWLFKRRHLRAG